MKAEGGDEESHQMDGKRAGRRLSRKMRPVTISSAISW